MQGDDMVELEFGMLVVWSAGRTFSLDMDADSDTEEHMAFEASAAPDDAHFGLSFDVGPKDEDWTEHFHLEVVTPNNKPEHLSHNKVMRIHSFSFEIFKTYLLTALKACERKTWDETLEELRGRFLWEYDIRGPKKKKK
jgi:hypothetical protein